jgi:hypothetical protein
MNRGNQVLTVVLVLQIALAVVLFWPRQPAAAIGEPLFVGLEVDQVIRLTLSDETGETVQLSRSGAAWVLPDAGNYPVTEGMVPDLLSKIGALKASRPVAVTEDSHARLKVAEGQFASRVEMLLQDNSLRTLYVGTSPSYGATHVRVANQNEVYLASDLSSADVATRLAGWIATSYFSVQAQEVVAVTLENDNGTFDFTKEGDDWTMAGLEEGETASSNNIFSVVTRATSVQMQRPLGTELKPSYGMHDPNAVLVIHARAPEGTVSTYTLHVGAQSEQDRSYVLKSSESPYYVSVAEYTAMDWVEKTREELLEQPEAE